MHMLQGEVEAITGSAKNEKPRAKGEPPTFVSNIVQIQFNAWHYADGNLWASLTAEFFDQLRVGGYSGTSDATHADLIKQVGNHIQSLESGAAQSKAKAKNLESKAESMANAVARSEQALARTELEIVGAHAGRQIEKLASKNKKKSTRSENAFIGTTNLPMPRISRRRFRN